MICYGRDKEDNIESSGAQENSPQNGGCKSGGGKENSRKQAGGACCSGR